MSTFPAVPFNSSALFTSFSDFAPPNAFEATLTVGSPQMWLIVATLFYFTVIGTHTRWTAWNYRGGEVGLVMAAHMISGLYEIFNWHIRSLYGTPMPKSVDILACLVQSGTNLILVTPLRRGRPRLTRPTYQAAALLRIALSFVAWQTNDPVLHEASVKIINSFVYARSLVWLFNCVELFETRHSDIYALGIFLSAVLATTDGPIKHLSKVYVLTLCLVVLVNQWTTEVLEGSKSKTSGPFERTLAKTLLSYGFANLETVQRYRQTQGLKDRPVQEGDFYASS
ncbi:hypothetical protein FRB99_005827 [Tulasnella sp. 403]|nr:hypothetical protein FRB99_005827 [Tulasnella sp. 403]